MFAFSIQGQNFVRAYRSNSGQSIQISQEQVLEINLPRVPSTGYIWCESNASSSDRASQQTIVQIGNNDFIHDAISGTSRGRMTGQSGTQILRYVGTLQGETKLTLELKRPWEDNNPPIDKYTITIETSGKYTGNYAPPVKENPQHITSTTRAVPSKWDWRSRCTPIKDQGQCGSCWAYAGCGTFEANIKIVDGNTKDLSEQWLVNCATDMSACQGGYCPHEYWKSPGCVYESDLPYTVGNCFTDYGTSATCQGTCGTYTHHETIDSYTNVAGENSDGIPPDANMKDAIYNYGPIWISLDASSTAFSDYSGGIFTESSQAGFTDHAVVLVGWVDSSAVSGGGYWILRNSWGTGWGINGYMYISYGSDLVGTDANYIVYKGGTPHNIPPVTNFSASSVSSCDGTILFKDFSVNFPTSWLWNFGDGGTSTLQNPSHTYTSSGTYTVSLKSTNSYGNNTLTKTSFVAINLAASPTTTEASGNGAGSVTLSASGSGTLKWYDSATNNNLVNTGPTYNTPVLSTTTTYYVENDVSNPVQSVGMPAKTTNGGYYTSTASQGLVFDTYVPLTINSVTVYANSTASRTIWVKDNSGTIITYSDETDHPIPE